MKKLIIGALMSLLLVPVTSFAWGRGGGYHGGGHGGEHGGGYHGRPGGGGYHGRPGGFHGHGNGYIGHPVHFYPGPTPNGGWRGRPYFYGGYNYYMWSWGPYAPFYGWSPYYGWRLGLYYYIPDGLRCTADNPSVQGEWVGSTQYYHSDDAINSALGLCESDPAVQAQGTQEQCRIRVCERW